MKRHLSRDTAASQVIRPGLACRNSVQLHLRTLSNAKRTKMLCLSSVNRPSSAWILPQSSVHGDLVQLLIVMRRKALVSWSDLARHQARSRRFTSRVNEVLQCRISKHVQQHTLCAFIQHSPLATLFRRSRQSAHQVYLQRFAFLCSPIMPNTPLYRKSRHIALCAIRQLHITAKYAYRS